MELIKCDKPHENAKFIIDLISKAQSKSEDNYWIISDLDLIPLFHGDYSGIGMGKPEEISLKFREKMEKESIAILSYNELLQILKDTQTIYQAVLISFRKNVLIDTKLFRPIVDAKNVEKSSHEQSSYEIRILDGDLFCIYDNL